MTEATTPAESTERRNARGSELLLLLVFAAGLLASSPCLCRIGTIIASYKIILLLLVFARLVAAAVCRRLTYSLLIIYAVIFFGFCYWTGFLH